MAGNTVWQVTASSSEMTYSGELHHSPFKPLIESY